MKLSKRLQHIENLVPNGYQHIWDCCCDHGFLGAALLQRQAAPHIHFVDIVPDLVATVHQRLAQFFSHSDSQWSTYCQDVAQLPLDQYSGKHLVIIAGVGGDLMTEMVTVLHQKFADLNVDFLLCPVYQQFMLRNALIDMNLSLKQEVLLEDKGRFYEILWVSQQPVQQPCEQISPTGTQLWQTNNQQQARIAQQYLDKTRQHYQRMQLSAPEEAKWALAEYAKIHVTQRTENAI